jgi:hypothetical protein
METTCPGRCDKAGMHRALNPGELCSISSRARAEITLLQHKALICEICRRVYVATSGETVLLGTLQATGQWDSVRFPNS